MPPTVKSGLKAALVASAVVLISSTALPLAQAGPDPVAAMTAPLYQRVNPATKANLVTPWADEASRAAATYNFTTNLGTPFKASTAALSGLTPVHRLFRSTGADFTWALEGSSTLATLVRAGYQDQGTNFFAAASPLSGTQAVNSYVSAGVHRLSLASAGSTLTSQGWSLEGSAFYVPATSGSSTPPTSPTPPAPPAPATGSPGAAPVGTTSYPAPSGAIYVSPSGNDAASGAVGSPVRTVARAVALAPSGGTVVLRAGRYHETVTIQGKALTVQSYPNEAAWLDGSESVTGWVQDGSAWRRDGWTTRFDHSPTYTRGAPDSSTPNWAFVNTSYPMASYPDQVFVDGVALQQVKSRNQVTAGTFYLNEATSQLFIGSDPRGHAVDASTLVKAMSVRGQGTVLRGIGIRRYAPSVPDIASVTLEATNIRLENVAVEDAATTGLGVLTSDAVLDHVTVRGSGMLGIHGRFADRLVMTSVLSTKNNDEHFNIAPVSGGAKLGATRGVRVSDSSFSGNYGHGFWEDLSVYDTVLRGSSFSDNSGDGMFLEISAKAVIVNNLIARNQMEGAKINNTSDVKIWNNTFVGNVARPLYLPQDTRRNTNSRDQAVDPRQPFPDPTMPWTLGPITLRNNVVAYGSGSAQCLLCVEDYGYRQSAEGMGITSDGNVYQRAAASTPQWLVVWSSGSTNPLVFTSLSQFTTRTGQDRRSREYTGSAAVTSTGALTDTLQALQAQIAVPLPSDIASIAGQPAGTTHVGRW